MGMDISPGMMGMLGGAAAGLALASRQPKIQMPAVATPDASPQPSQAPDSTAVVDAMKGTGQAGGSPGIAQTFLTGGNGVNQQQVKTLHSRLYGSP